MPQNITENLEFQELIQNHCKEQINFFISKGIDFSVVANISNITFEPDLPNDLKDNLSKFSLFTLAGYTFQSAYIKEESLFFEAGFGKDNFGSLVQIPFSSIFQIIKNDNIVFINISATFENMNKNPKNKSMNIFKNNPNNSKFN
ncbi:hypothetical protein N5T98_05125 [Aliarcobacter cryaerophilus]|uniref:hypothetical protein n=1 Tax=Aliarcobacter cryaerophilus TaxID=28198 RepID=UPI0021B5F3D6|nr:hypothetical protein [Aliarcobacter cryaerophilus]MCT7485926.1 hypothetical protein [Aliarcobacter cryaerophilus]MCT7490470.1 hypothetical protein [Aliarcobacter cryaerophilus]